MRFSYQIRHEKFIHLHGSCCSIFVTFHILCVGGDYNFALGDISFMRVSLLVCVYPLGAMGDLLICGLWDFMVILPFLFCILYTLST